MAETGNAAKPLLLYLVTEDWAFCSHRLPTAQAAVDAGYHVGVLARVAAHGAVIKALGYALYPLSWARRSLNPLLALRDLWQITQLYRSLKPHLVHHVALKAVLLGGLAARLAPVPHQIAAVNGVAVGAGCDITLASDLRVASTTARFGQAYIKLAFCPDAGGSFLLPRLIGEARAMEMIYTGRMIQADEADRIGLLNALVEPEALMETAQELAGRLAKGPTVAIGLSKQNIRQNALLTIEEALLNERRAGNICGKTEDAKEGLAATIERRDANFKGR